MSSVQSYFFFLFASIVAYGTSVIGLVGIACTIIIFSFFILSISVLLQRDRDIMQLDIIFIAFLIIYSISVPLSELFTDSYVSETTIYCLSLCFLACIGFSLGSLFGQSKRIIKRRFSTKVDFDVRAARASGYIVFFSSLFFTFVAISTTVGASRYLNAGYAGRALLKREAGPIELGLYAAVVGLMLILASYLVSKNKRRVEFAFLLLSFLFFIGFVSSLGIRRPTFLLLLSSIAILSLLRQNIGVGRSILIGIPLFFLFATFAEYRQILSDVGLIEALVFIGSNFSSDWLNVADSELGAPFRTLSDTVSRGDIQHLYGYSYVITPLYIIPSFLTGGVESMSMIYTREFFSDIFISIGGNMGYFPITEALVNFGSLGIVFIFALFALLISKINFMLHMKYRYTVMFVVFCSLLVPWMAFFMRLDVASFSKGFLYSQVVPYTLAYFLYSKFAKRV